MSERIPVNPGNVEWCGDNPGIYLKIDPEGDWSVLGIFFRILLSPHGRGHTMIILGEPDEPKGFPAVNNICLSDNEALTDYLVADFMSKFPTFRGRSGLQGMARLPMQSIKYDGDMKEVYREIATSGDTELCMEWRKMSDPMAVEVTPKDSATGEHDMYSVFLEAQEASIMIDGKRLEGNVVDRQFFGKTMSTAFLAVSETWVKPSQSRSQ